MHTRADWPKGVFGADNRLIFDVSKTRTQDPSSIIQLPLANTLSRYFLHTSGHEAAQAAGQGDVDVIIYGKTEAALLYRIPFSSRLRAVTPRGSVAVRKK